MSSSTNKPEMAVIIPTMGRDILLRTLESILALKDLGRLEVVVVGIIPDPVVLEKFTTLMSAHPLIRHLNIRFEKGDASEKRNAGSRATVAPILAFLDDDVYVPPDWLDHMLACFENPEVGVVSGPSLVPDDISRFARLAGLALSSRAAGYVAERYGKGSSQPRFIKWSGIIGCNMLFRRSVFEELGGFDPDFYPGEEMRASFLVSRKGYKLMFNPAAPVFHYPKQTFKGFWKQIYRYGATRIRLIRSGVEVEPGPLVPGIWVLSLVVLGVGANWSSFLFYLLMLDLALYFLVIVWFTTEVVMKTRRAVDIWLLLVHPFMHLSYGVGMWFEILRPDKDLSDELGRPTN
ncbi:MAG TPA: glycosyltransferase [Kiritimatiellia bacterium]|nr:glycosyltransferase [Kiritimatiellia bacterium]